LFDFAPTVVRTVVAPKKNAEHHAFLRVSTAAFHLAAIACGVVAQPQTMLRSALIAPIAAVGAFEVVAWGFDPLGVHTALNDGQSMAVLPKVGLCALNGGLLVYLASLLQSPRSGRSRRTCVISAIVPMFTFAQWTFWWWPYLLGRAAGTLAMQLEHKEQLRGVASVLPTRGDNLVPDLEHTLLMPLSLAMLAVTAILVRQVPATSRDKQWFLGVGSMLALTQVAFALKGADGPLAERGPLLSFVQILCGVALLWRQLGADVARA
jgi:DNA polymerase III psi subunit